MFHTAPKLPVAVVSGGAGFLGSHLCEALLLQNCQVICLDNLKTGKKENISHLLEKPNFELLELDIKNPLPQTLSPPDYIFHLAGVEEYLSDCDLDLETLLVNAQGTFNLLELARNRRAKFLLVSSINIYAGVLSSSSLSSYFGSDLQHAKRFSHHEAKRYAEALVVSYFQKYDLDARVLRVANVYGPRMEFSAGTEIARLFFNEAQQGGKLIIGGDGLTVLHPTYVSDVIYGLTKAMFSEGTRGGIYNLVNPSEVTVLQFAYALKEARGGGLKVEFNKEKESMKFPIQKIELTKTQEDLGWQAKIEIAEGIRKTLEWADQDKSQKPESIQEKPTIEPERPRVIISLPKLSLPTFKFSFVSAILLSLGALLLIFLLPAAIFFYNFTQGFLNLNSAQKSLLVLDFKTAGENAKKAEAKFNLAQKNFGYSSWLLTRLGQKERAIVLQNILSFGETSALATEHLGLSSQALVGVFRGVTSQNASGEDELSKELGTARLELELALTNLSLAQIFLKEVPPDVNVPFARGKIQNIRNNLPSYQKNLSDIRLTMQILPETIGFLGQRTYLVIFQNNMEIRPTGGFIGSYALLTFNKGKLTKLDVSDIYTADGQLKESIEPPKPFKDLLKQDKWFMRDANWSPDFTESALRVEWFLEKELGQKVDGVVAIDLTLAQYFLSATGPQKLTDFDETVTAENLFLKAETYSEVGFFPGSTQKKDFMLALSKQMINALLSSKEGAWPQILTALETGLLEKHLLIFLHDKTLSQMVSDKKWDGKVEASEKDYLMIVDTNLSGNKTNFFVKRKILDQVSFDKELGITHRLIINYDNTSPNETWPAGKYRQWLRVLVPSGAELGAVENGENRSLAQVETTNVRDKTVFALAVEVPIQTKRNIVLEYKLPKNMAPTGQNPTYQIYLQKQPGVIDDSFALEINYPAYLSVSQAQPAGLIKPGIVNYNTNLKTDREFKVVFKR